MMNFLFDGNTGRSYEDIQRERAMAQRMFAASQSKAPQTIGEGLSALGSGLAHGLKMRALRKQENEGRQAFAEQYDRFLRPQGNVLIGGEPAVPPGAPADYAPPPPPNDDQRLMQLAQLAGNEFAPKGAQTALGLLLQQEVASRQPKKRPTSVQEYTFAQEQGFSGSFEDWERARANDRRPITTVRVNGGGPTIPEYSRLPKGYVYVRNPDGSPVFDENGLPKIAPIPGSEAARDVQQGEAKRRQRQESTTNTAKLVLDDVNRIVQRVKGAPALAPATGFLGSLFRNVGGTAAYDVDRLTDTLQGNIGFDRLQRMREESPTGGALGAISERELSLLSSVLGSLDTAQSEEQLLANLERLSTIYVGIMEKASAYPNAGQFGFGGGGNRQGAGTPGRDGVVRMRLNTETGELEPAQ